jgi:hypothetical protein
MAQQPKRLFHITINFVDNMASDIEIAQKATMMRITEVASRLGGQQVATYSTAVREGGRANGKVIGALKAHPDAALIDFGAVSKLVQSKLV